MKTKENRSPVVEFQQRLLEDLSMFVCNVTFVKKNRTKRTGWMTTDLRWVPAADQPKGTGKPLPPGSGLLRVYDFKRMGWRTIRLAFVTSYRLLTPEEELGLKFETANYEKEHEKK